MIDLPVEAEAFGSEIRTSYGRAAIYIKAIETAAKEISDRPVLAGVIGPFSLAGRFMDMTKIMVNCYEEPGMVSGTLKKNNRVYHKLYSGIQKGGSRRRCYGGACRRFIVSSSCDIPSMSHWENIESFFKAVKDFYSR